MFLCSLTKKGKCAVFYTNSACCIGIHYACYYSEQLNTSLILSARRLLAPFPLLRPLPSSNIDTAHGRLPPGKDPTEDYLEGMMGEAPGPINFTMFLTLFGERLQGTDPEEVIKNAFGCFDEENAGVISEDRLRELLTTMGDRFTDDEVGDVLRCGGADYASVKGDADLLVLGKLLL